MCLGVRASSGIPEWTPRDQVWLMILSCERCQARYAVDEARFGAARRSVRCSSCGHVWEQAPASADDGEAVAARSAFAQDIRADAAARGGEPAREEPIRLFAAGPRPRTLPVKSKPSRFGGKALVQMVAPTAALIAALILLRGPLTDLWPPAARLYAALGFSLPGAAPFIAIRDVHTEEQTVGDKRKLVVDGQIANLASETKASPTLSATVAQDGRVLARWSFTASASELAPGGSVPFHTELDQPPDQAGSVVVGLAR